MVTGCGTASQLAAAAASSSSCSGACRQQAHSTARFRAAAVAWSPSLNHLQCALYSTAHTVTRWLHLKLSGAAERAHTHVVEWQHYTTFGGPNTPLPSPLPPTETSDPSPSSSWERSNTHCPTRKPHSPKKPQGKHQQQPGSTLLVVFSARQGPSPQLNLAQLGSTRPLTLPSPLGRCTPQLSFSPASPTALPLSSAPQPCHECCHPHS